MDEDGIILTSYWDERQQVRGKPPGEALVDLYGRQEVAASILLRGAEGSAAIAVDTWPRIEAVLDQVTPLTGSGLVTTQRTRLLAGEIEPGSGWARTRARRPG